eukprot:PhF_6_TR30123/c0_g1_i1/m.44023/K11304/TIP60, KAT5, ESA1; histone acetyltransferase HTATIP
MFSARDFSSRKFNMATIIDVGELNEETVYCVRTSNRQDTWLSEQDLVQRYEQSLPLPVVIEKPSMSTSTSKDWLARRFLNDHKRAKNIRNVMYGDHVMEAWYFSPYHVVGATPPPELGKVSDIFLCRNCLCPYPSAYELDRHYSRCQSHPFGNTIYIDETNRFEVLHFKSADAPRYTRYLILLGKLFLQDKFLGGDLNTYEFYTLIVHGSQPTEHRTLAGFFSHEINNTTKNLSCIVTLPPFQSRGYGAFLVDFSYFLSKRRKRLEGPEFPLSEYGKLVYHSYWNYTVLNYILQQSSKQGDDDTCSTFTIRNVAETTGIQMEVVYETLERLGLLHKCLSTTGGMSDVIVSIVQPEMCDWIFTESSRRLTVKADCFVKS